jgi:hypothetical protein
MVESPPLEELAARKRLVQAHMEIYRAELALYSHQVLTPIDKAVHLTSNPVTRWSTILGLAGLYLTGRSTWIRSPWVRRGLQFIVPMVSGRLKQFVVSAALGWILKKIRPNR